MTDTGVSDWVAMDGSASQEEFARVQALFDELDLDLKISRILIRESAELLPWEIIISMSVGTFLTAFAKNAGKELGRRVGEGLGDAFKEWLGRLHAARAGRGTVIIRDESIRAEIVLAPDLPAAAIKELAKQVKAGEIGKADGHLIRLRYREDAGWARPSESE
jgi:hypothetical protein